MGFFKKRFARGPVGRNSSINDQLTLKKKGDFPDWLRNDSCGKLVQSWDSTNVAEKFLNFLTLYEKKNILIDYLKTRKI